MMHSSVRSIAFHAGFAVSVSMMFPSMGRHKNVCIRPGFGIWILCVFVASSVSGFSAVILPPQTENAAHQAGLLVVSPIQRTPIERVPIEFCDPECEASEDCHELLPAAAAGAAYDDTPVPMKPLRLRKPLRPRAIRSTGSGGAGSQTTSNAGAAASQFAVADSSASGLSSFPFVNWFRFEESIRIPSAIPFEVFRPPPKVFTYEA